MAPRAQRGAVPRRRALPDRRAQRRGRPVRPHATAGSRSSSSSPTPPPTDRSRRRPTRSARPARWRTRRCWRRSSPWSSGWTPASPRCSTSSSAGVCSTTPWCSSPATTVRGCGRGRSPRRRFVTTWGSPGARSWCTRGASACRRSSAGRRGSSERGPVHAVSHFTDWVPSLLAVAGHGEARRLPGDGVDLLPSSARREPLERTPPRFWQWSRYGPTPFANAAVRDGDWKLRYPAAPELFDILPSDPVEERRLAADPEHYRPRCRPRAGPIAATCARRPSCSTSPPIRESSSTSPASIRNGSPAWRSSWPTGTRASSRSGRRSPTSARDRPPSRSHDPTSVQCDMVPSRCYAMTSAAYGGVQHDPRRGRWSRDIAPARRGGGPI